MSRSVRSTVVVEFLFLVCVGVTCLLLCCGCTTLDLRGEVPEQNDLSSLARQARPIDPNVEPFTFSNKARAIEADLGVGQTSRSSNPQF